MNDHTDDLDIQLALDRLGELDRRTPDDGYEARILDAMRTQPTDRTPGRRRKSTAWIPFVTAACVALMGYIAWMPSFNVNIPEKPGVAIVDQSGVSTDILLSSFDAMDMLIADSDEMDESLDWIEARIDAAKLDLSPDSTWQELGGSL